MAQMHGKQSEYVVKKSTWHKTVAFIVLGLMIILLTLMVEHIKSLMTNKGIFITYVLILPLVAIFYFIGNKSLDKYTQYNKGNKGEGSIYFELQKLPTEYIVFQDVLLPNLRSNIDFVVLGPTGFFTIEAKNYSGYVTLENGILIHDNVPFERDPIKQVLGQWTSLRTHLENKLNGQTSYIQPILVFSGSSVKLNFGMKPVIKNIIIIKKEWLNEVIIAGQQKFTPEEVLRISVELEKLVAK